MSNQALRKLALIIRRRLTSHRPARLDMTRPGQAEWAALYDVFRGRRTSPIYGIRPGQAEWNALYDYLALADREEFAALAQQLTAWRLSTRL